MKIAKYKSAYRISPEESEDYGVLIRYGTDDAPQWWLLCPSATSIYPGDQPDFEVCSAPLCKYDEIHQGANEILRLLSRTPSKDERIAELEAALKPFAEAASNMTPNDFMGLPWTDAARVLRGAES